MPDRPSLDQLYAAARGGSAPQQRQRPSLDELYQKAGGAVEPSGGRGFLDTLKNMTGRDWLATAVRLGGGYAAGIPAMVPGVGTLAGAGIGAGSEALAELIGGHGFDLPAIGVGGAMGAVPMGKVFSAAKGLGLGARAAQAAGNITKGAALNTGVDMAYRGAHGELPFRDYSLREEIVPAAIGAGGAAAADTLGAWLERFKKPQIPGAPWVVKNVGSGQTPAAAAQGGFDFQGPSVESTRGGRVSPTDLAKARAAMRDPEAIGQFEQTWGPQGAPPPAPPRPTPPPEPLGLPNKLFPSNAKPWEIAARLFGDPTQPSEVGAVGEFSNPRRVREPFNTSGDLAYRQSLDDIYEQARAGMEGVNANRPAKGPVPGPEPVTSDALAQMFGLDAANQNAAGVTGGAIRPRGPVPPDTPLPMPAGFQPTNANPIDLLVEQLGLDKGLGAGQLDVMDPHQVTLNGSGESAASAEALSRQRGMQAKGESFVVYDRTGQKRPLMGPDAVDYNPRPGETFGIEGPNGFQTLTDNGGRAPVREFVRSEPMVGPQPTLPGASADHGAAMLTPPLEAGTVPRGTPPYAAQVAERSRGALPVLPEGSTIDQPMYPRRVYELYQEMQPIWEADYQKMRAAGGPIIHDPRQSFPDFAFQTMFEENPRNLMSKQRKVRLELDKADPSSLEMVDHQGNPIGGGPDVPPGAVASPTADAGPVAPVAAGAPTEAPGAPGGYQPNKSIKQKAADIIQEFMDRVPEPGPNDDILYHRADAIRQAKAAAVEALRAEVGGTKWFKKLPVDLQAELRRIREEMVDFKFTKRTVHEPEPGMGGTRTASAGAAGAPVFHDIMEGKGGSRSQVTKALDSFIAGKNPSVIAKRALDVALRRLAGDDSVSVVGQHHPSVGWDNPELGGASQDLLYTLGGAATGAAVGTLWDKDKANPAVSGLGGAATGALLALAARNPEFVERMRSAGLFSGAAIPKSFLGNVGGITAYGLEHPSEIPELARQTFSRDTLDAAKQAWQGGAAREATSAKKGPLSWPGRAIGAPDAATRDVIQRTIAETGSHGNLPGIAGESAAAEGGRYTLSGDPRSDLGQKALGFSGNRWARLFAPVMRTPINWFETGLERLPGVGSAGPIANLDPTADAALRLRRQALGTAAMVGGGAAGYAAKDTDYGALIPYLAALAGPYGLPLTVGTLAGGTDWEKGGLNALVQTLMGLKQSLPLPGGYDRPEQMLKSFIPFSGAMRMLSPIAPSDFDTSSSYFAPAVSNVPILNELLLRQKRTPRPRRPGPPVASK